MTVVDRSDVDTDVDLEDLDVVLVSVDKIVTVGLETGLVLAGFVIDVVTVGCNVASPGLEVGIVSLGLGEVVVPADINGRVVPGMLTDVMGVGVVGEDVRVCVVPLGLAIDVVSGA